MNLNMNRATSAKPRCIAHSLCYKSNLSAKKRIKNIGLNLIKKSMSPERPLSS